MQGNPTGEQLSLIPERTCRICGATKPLEGFRRLHRSPTGRDSVCHECNRRIAREWRLANLERERERQREWRSKPENQERMRETARSRYHADPERAREQNRRWVADNLEKRREIVRRSDERNRDKRRAYNRWYAAQRKEQTRERQREWKAANPEWVRSQNAARRVACAQTRDYTLTLSFDPCCYCGAPTDEIDHIDPISRGGANQWENLTASCKACNRAKSNRALLAWMAIR